MGQLDEKFASLWLDGDDSDQQRMIGAMDSAGCGRGYGAEGDLGNTSLSKSCWMPA